MWRRVSQGHRGLARGGALDDRDRPRLALRAGAILAFGHPVRGLAAIHGALYRANPDMMDPDVAIQIEQGFRVPATEVARGMETSQQIRRCLGAFFADFDLMLSPTTPCVAWPHTELGPAIIGGKPVDARGHAAFTPLYNHGQNPAISIPCGRGRAGLPIGLQIAAGVGEDHRVLAFAAHAERILAEAGLWTGLA